MLRLAVAQAYDAGITDVDTAVMYNNGAVLAELAAELPGLRVCSKLKRADRLAEDLALTEQLFGSSLHRVLLHRPMSYGHYAVLEDALDRGVVQEIGVSNYSAADLQALLAVCRHAPQVVQNEFHPCITTPVPALCRQHGIRFEAHSTMSANDHVAVALATLSPAVLTNATTWHPAPLPPAPQASAAVAQPRAPTPAQVAVASCVARGADAVAISTTNFDHLAEILAAATQLSLTPETFHALALLPFTHPVRGYRSQGPQLPQSPLQPSDPPVPPSAFASLLLHDGITAPWLAAQLHDDLAGLAQAPPLPPSTLALRVPKLRLQTQPQRTDRSRHHPHANVLPISTACAIAQCMFGSFGTVSAYSKFDGAMKRLRRALSDRKAAAALHSALEGKTCSYKAVEVPDALPVDVPDGAEFDGFLHALSSLKGPRARKFQRGALFPDGRMDMCKQVIRPRFPELCIAVANAAPGVVSHFLLGNNIVFRKQPARGAVATAAETHPAAAAAALAAAAPDPAHAAGSGDEVAAANLAALLALIAKGLPIKTFYLAGNGIDAESSVGIAQALSAAPSHDLDALWLKMNPIKTGAYDFGRLVGVRPHLKLLDLFNCGLCDDGAAAFAAGLKGGLGAAGGADAGLRHLYLCLNAFTAAAVPDIIAAIKLLPELESLYLGENDFGDAGARDLLTGLPTMRKLQRFELGSCGMTDASLPALHAFVARHCASGASAGAGASVGGQLQVLTLGSYKSTSFFKLKPNQFADVDGLVKLIAPAPAPVAAPRATAAVGGVVEAARLLASSPSPLKFLGLDKCLASHEVASDVVTQATAAAPGCIVDAVQRGKAAAGLVTSTMANGGPLDRSICHPEQLQWIQSIYRNKM